MRKQEQRLWDTMRRNASRSLWLQRVENSVGVGMPDVYVGCSGAWVELKAPHVPKRATTRLLGDEGLSVDQINWHLKAANKGRVSWVLIRDNQNRLFLIPGSYATVINDMNAEKLSFSSFADNWKDILHKISLEYRSQLT